ncbi:hypothetical protein AMECASPLE_033438 [Ameca splendens]|uniref:PH domain-containing protein n=1 Tax=Ameca splendens TaxID=208324 RepID=A0ABV1A287_9TELE
MDGAFPSVRVKSEREEESEAWNAELQKLDHARASLRGATFRLAAEAGLGADEKLRTATPLFQGVAKSHGGGDAGGDAGGGNVGGFHNIAVPLKTPKYAGKSS